MLSMLLVLVGLVHAQGGAFPESRGPGSFGVGLVAGATSGVSLAWRPNAWNAVQSAVGWDFTQGRVDVSADYLQSVKVFDPSPAVRLPVYVGVGGEVMTAPQSGRDNTPAGSVRVPIGVSAFFQHVPIEVFAQVVPALRVIPRTGVGVDAAVGGRYYF